MIENASEDDYMDDDENENENEKMFTDMEKKDGPNSMIIDLDTNKTTGKDEYVLETGASQHAPSTIRTTMDVDVSNKKEMVKNKKINTQEATKKDRKSEHNQKQFNEENLLDDEDEIEQSSY